METSLLNFQDLSLPQRPLYDSLKSCFAVNRYDRWTFFLIDRSDPIWGMSLYQNVSFPVRKHLKLFQLSGRLARRLFCIPWYFVVPHFISFNCKLLNTQFSHKEKQGHPTAIFGKISVRKTIWDLEFSEYRIYSINRPGRLLNFWTLRVGAYSRLGAY